MLFIDPAQAEHTEDVWRMLQRFATSYAPSRGAFDRDYPRLIEDDRVDLLVAREDEAVVGYLLAHRTPTLFAGGPILGIAELYVEEVRRGKGIGQALVRAALERGWAAGCVEAVVPTRRARGFYERLGFATTAEFLKLRRFPSRPSSSATEG